MAIDSRALRLDPMTYIDDVGVGLVTVRVDQDPDDAQWVEVPEQLYDRLVELLRAYRLHSAEVLPSSDERRLNREQVGSLTEDLRFIRGIVQDPALHGVIDELDRAATSVWRGSGHLELLISPP